MKVPKSKKNTYKKKGGAFETHSGTLLSVKDNVYDNKDVQNDYSEFKTIVKSHNFFQSNDDLLRNIFEFSVSAGRKFKVIQQFIKKYPKLQKVIVRILGFPITDASEYFDISDISNEYFSINVSYSMLDNNGRPIYVLENEHVQPSLNECIQIRVLDNYFKILNETEYAELENLTALEVDEKIKQMKGHIAIFVTLKHNTNDTIELIGVDDLVDSNDSYQHFEKSVYASLHYSDVQQFISFNKDELDCSPLSPRNKTPSKTPSKTRKRKQYPLATRKSARLQR